ncbi:MAG TPA: ankyrin repeat domain-containing protein [Bryobacteraceae bacterium]|nr:ankyrin repeat domain-containing protein [Bryobacteraceae bacterium]
MRWKALWVTALLTAMAFAGTNGDTKLADAAQQQDDQAVTSLLKLHADANAAQPDGTTALHWAARWNDVAMADALIRAGANVKAKNRFGATPLFLACTNGGAAMIEALLKGGEDANAVVSEAGDTALMLAARTGKPDALMALLEHGADPNKTNLEGQTALMWAASEKNSAAVKTLIDHGADVNAQTHKLPPPSPFQLIFSAPFPAGGMTALIYAARQNDLESAKILLAARANVNEDAADGSSPLLVAVINEHYALAKFLLEHGADPNAADAQGRAPLYAAIDMRNLEWSTRPAPPEKDSLSDLDFIQALLDHGANPNARLVKKIPLRGQPSFDGRWANAIGATPFWRAAQSDDVAVMKLLKERGADPLIATKDHTTPLMVAAGVGWSDGQSHGSQADAPEALKLCLEWGGDVNAVNDEGYTALHGASFRGANEVVQFLVDHGAKLDVKNKDGRMPINMAEGMHIGPGGWVEHDDTVALFHKLMAQKQ